MQKILRSLLAVIIITVLLLPIFSPQDFNNDALPAYTPLAKDTSPIKDEIKEAPIYTWEEIDTTKADEVKALLFSNGVN